MSCTVCDLFLIVRHMMTSFRLFNWMRWIFLLLCCECIMIKWHRKVFSRGLPSIYPICHVHIFRLNIYFKAKQKKRFALPQHNIIMIICFMTLWLAATNGLTYKSIMTESKSVILCVFMFYACFMFVHYLCLKC